MTVLSRIVEPSVAVVIPPAGEALPSAPFLAGNASMGRVRSRKKTNETARTHGACDEAIVKEWNG